jgi:hypothetical protein
MGKKRVLNRQNDDAELDGNLAIDGFENDGEKEDNLSIGQTERPDESFLPNDGQVIPLSKRAAKKQRKRLRMLEEGVQGGQSQLNQSNQSKSPLLALFTSSKDGLEISTEANAEAQAAAFQALFLSSTVGKNLTVLEIGVGGINAEKISIPTRRSSEDIIRAKQGGTSKSKANKLSDEIEGGIGLEDSTSTTSTTSSDIKLVFFIRSIIPDWQKVFGWRHKANPRPVGSPACVIITYSAQRAASLLGPLSAFKSRIGKCFAKHFSLDEQRSLLTSEPPILLAVGTPNRLIKLIESEILSLSHCSTIIFDMQLDPKGFHLLESFATREDCFVFSKMILTTYPTIKFSFYSS